MKTNETRLAPALAALALLALAPAANAGATAAPAPRAAAAATTAAAPEKASVLDSLDKLDPALRNYLLTAISKTLEQQGQSESDTDPVSMVRNSLEVVKGIPTDKLPAGYQNYVKENMGLADKLLEELKGASEPDPAALLMAVAKLEQEFAALKAKYPKESAAMDSVTTLMQDMMKEPATQLKIKEYLDANQEAFKGKSQQEIMKEVMLFMSKEVAKLIK